MHSYYPYDTSAPVRTFVSAEVGQTIHVEHNAAAVTAGQVITTPVRILTDQRHGVMCQISGILEAYDVESVVCPPNGNNSAFSLVPYAYQGNFAWVASPHVRSWFGSPSFTLAIKFRVARPSVTVRVQCFPY